MALFWRNVPSFNTKLYEFILKLEAPQWNDRRQIHFVGGNPTIGIGFDLRRGGARVQNAELERLGFDPSLLPPQPPPPLGTAARAEYDYIAQIRGLLASAR